MYRIRTKVSDTVMVSTLFSPHSWSWVTIKKVNIDGRIYTTSTDASSEYEAGINHLAFCK